MVKNNIYKDLTPTVEQEQCIQQIYEWYNNEPSKPFQISGLAGTGKSTMVRMAIDNLGLSSNQVLYMAFVGKATLELTKKGNKAATIHSTIYDIVKQVKTDENGNAIKINDKVVMVPYFKLKDRLDPDVKLLVIDEGGMVPEKIGKEIATFNIPTIVLGDNNQLDPVFGDRIYLKNPDFVLTEPMRQAKDSPIIRLAHDILQGKPIRIYNDYGEGVKIVSQNDKSFPLDEKLLKADAIICHRNESRRLYNNYIRKELLKRKSNSPEIGDKLICRRNNYTEEICNGQFNLVNGMCGHISHINTENFDGSALEIDFIPDFINKPFQRISINYERLVYNKETENRYDYRNQFEYGYAITCHVAQGSEYDNVVVFNEPINYMRREEYTRWIYTAVTRAKKNIIVVQ